MGKQTIFHADGTVTYWSVYHQHWCERTAHVPDRELAAMPETERAKVQRHLRHLHLVSRGD